MIDPDEREQEALKVALRFMGELIAEIGWSTRLNDLSADQAAKLAEAHSKQNEKLVKTASLRPAPAEKPTTPPPDETTDHWPYDYH